MSTKDKIITHMTAGNEAAIDRMEQAIVRGLPWQAKLCSAQRELGQVVKDSRVAFGSQRYAYTSAEDMIGACRSALLANGLALVREYRIRFDAEMSFVVSTFTLHTDNGESVVVGQDLPWPIVESNGKGSDKSLATALTSSLGYFLRDLLLVPKEDDAKEIVKAPEMDARDDRGITAPAATLGIRGAAALHKKLNDAGLSLAALTEAMAKAGVDLPEDPAAWPKAIVDRVDVWVNKNKVNR